MRRFPSRASVIALVMITASGLAEGPPSGRKAQFLSASGVPASMSPGEKATVSLTFKNTSTGGSIWSMAASYMLGSRRPADNMTWGLNRVPLSATDSIPVGKEKTFTFSFQAPSSPGTYTFGWSLIKEGYEWVGDVYETRIEVAAREGAASSPDPLDESRIAAYDIALSDVDWKSIVSHPDAAAWRSCTVVWNKNETFEQVGIRGAQGSVAPNFVSLSLKFDAFIKSQRFHSLKRLKLYSNAWDPSGSGPTTYDSTLMKNRIAYEVYRSVGVEAPRIPYCWVSINRASGRLYGVEERTDREFFVSRFGREVSQAYKWTNSSKGVWIAGRDYEWQGDQSSSYVPFPFAPQIDSAEQRGADLLHLLDVINNHPGDISSVLDVESFLRFMAVEQVVDDIDGYCWGWDGSATLVNNHVLCRNPSSGKFVFLKWDADHSYAVDAQKRSIFANFDRHVLTRRVILENKANQDRYKALIRQLIHGYHDTGAMCSRIDRVKDQIDAYVRQDPFRKHEDWVQAVNAMKQRIRERNDYLNGQLP